MRKFLPFSLLLLFSFLSSTVFSQSCFNINAGNDTIISCLQACLDLHARIPDVKTSETYQVTSITYNPYPYVTPTGTEDALVYDDDHFSDSFFLPFPFCFYGNTYNKTCVGSNGVITFDVLSNAKTIEGYILDPGNILPFAGSSPNVQNTYYAPKASIFLAYYDMNPLTSPPERKIQWEVQGTAPCRRFVVSFYHIGNYDFTNDIRGHRVYVILKRSRRIYRCLMFTERQIILFQHHLQMAVDDKGGLIVFKDLCPVRHDPYLVEGIDRHLGCAIHLLCLCIDLVPKYPA